MTSLKQSIKDHPKGFVAVMVMAALVVAALIFGGVFAFGIPHGADPKANAAEKPTSSASPSPSASSDEKVGVKNPDGTITQAPVYNGNGQPVIVDSTQNADTRPLLARGDRYKASPSDCVWDNMVKRIAGDPQSQGYYDGLNRLAAITGFSVDDIKRYAADTKGQSYCVIMVFDMPSVTDAQARDAVAKYMGSAFADDPTLQVIHRTNLMNTRNAGTDGNLLLQDFHDNEPMIRVSLVAPKYVNGKPAGIDAANVQSGIFVDCANIWYIAQQIWSCTDSSCTPPPPPTIPPTTPPTTPPTPTCPPDMPNGYIENGILVCKTNAEGHDPGSTGNNLPGGNGAAGPADSTSSAPAAGDTTPVYTPPAPPTEAPAPAPVVTPQPAPSPLPTVDPSTQPPNNGQIDPNPGPSSPACNPDFQSC